MSTLHRSNLNDLNLGECGAFCDGHRNGHWRTRVAETAYEVMTRYEGVYEPCSVCFPWGKDSRRKMAKELHYKRNRRLA